MSWTLPTFGTAILVAVLLAAAYTFVLAVGAGVTGRLRTLVAARHGAYGVVALVASAVGALAYAFLTHDFRLRYVARYSDRSMPLGYLVTALWGGQDGSLLWWLFLSSLYIAAFVYTQGLRERRLQPWALATLMSVVAFFAVLMLFAANPFATGVSAGRADGEGLNPLLQNFYMIIHPPSLYVGFVGCAVPFAFATAALVTGDLDERWLLAVRRWMLFAWTFLTIGNVLGMLWAYEELGWGGYWAWDPVENAAFMPLLSASAFLHSTMIQERRGLFRVWNVVLVGLTFFMTIFGTFLTRSGLIASVHSFAQSSIGGYFAAYMGILFLVWSGLVAWRWPELRGLPATLAQRRAALGAWAFSLLVLAPGLVAIHRLALPMTAKVLLFAALGGGGAFAATELVHRRLAGAEPEPARPVVESVLSREFTFLMNNWGLLGMMGVILVATLFPLFGELLAGEKVTVAPPHYNAWVQPLGLLLFFLMGAGSLFGWRKTSEKALRNAFVFPVGLALAVGALHAAFGARFGFAAIVPSEQLYAGPLGAALAAFGSATPLLGTTLCAFNAAVTAQEFATLLGARKKSGALGSTERALWFFGLVPGVVATVLALSAQARRRYGGYVVHFGIMLMFLGFTGKSWSVTREATLAPGGTLELAPYTLRYEGPRMEVDASKRMIFADIAVTRAGKAVGTHSPAKFLFKRMPQSPTTEVAMVRGLADDLYLVVGTINPETKVATIQAHVNPLTSWIWLGALVMLLGSVLCMWPEPAPEESRAFAFGRSAAAVVASLVVGLLVATMPAYSYADPFVRAASARPEAP
jgi:cytochrome c-type biogenesis protein CcmF